MKISQKNQEVTITFTVSMAKAKFIIRWLEEVLSWLEPEVRRG